MAKKNIKQKRSKITHASATLIVQGQDEMLHRIPAKKAKISRSGQIEKNGQKFRLKIVKSEKWSKMQKFNNLVKSES